MAINLFDVIKKACVSTKSIALNRAKSPKIVIFVNINANKIMIKEAVKVFFGAEPLSVNTILVKGKRKRSKKGFYVESDYKKAIVTFKNIDNISQLVSPGDSNISSFEEFQATNNPNNLVIEKGK